MTIRYVTPLDSIQDKIDEAGDGDVIIVYEGIYGAIDFGGKAITIQNYQNDFVKIDAGLFHRCVTFDTSETSTSILSGITITNGYAKSDNEQYGGGIYIGMGCSPKIKNCVIENCKADYSGGGIFCRANSTAIFENCIIQNNQCSIDSTFYYGGGVGIETRAVGGIQLINCLIINNYSYGKGGGVYGDGADHILLNCTIYGNEAVGDGGGVYVGGGKYNFTYYTSAGGTDPGVTLDEMVHPNVLFYIDEIRLCLSVAHTSIVDFVIWLSSGLGSMYNVIFLSQAMYGETNVVYQFERAKRFRATDGLCCSMVMSASNYYGITISGWTIINEDE